MNVKSLQTIIDDKTWHFAKTMPWHPHFYARRREWGDEKEFETVVKFIRENGVEEKFGKRQFTYLYLNGYKYWTMGSPVAKTILINRAKA